MFLGEKNSHIYPNKFGGGPTVVSRKKGRVQTDRQTDTQRDAAALYSRRETMTEKHLLHCTQLM